MKLRAGWITLCVIAAAIFAGAVARPAQAQHTILLHSRSFVPPPGLSIADRAAIVAQLPTSLPRVYALVQLNAVPTPTQVSALAALGVVRVAAVPQRGWIASMPRSAAALSAIAAQPSVRSIVPLLASDRIAPEIASDGIAARLIDASGDALLSVRVADDLAVASVVPFVLPFVTSVDAQSDTLHSLRVRMPPANLNGLAGQGYVLLIDELPPPNADDNDSSRANTRAGEVQIVEDVIAAGMVVGNQPGEPQALDGTGVRIGQWEGDRPDTCHPDFAGTLERDGSITGTTLRVTNGIDDDEYSDDDCRVPGYNPDTDEQTGFHASHVAGTMVGNGAESAPYGLLPVLVRGYAPNAEIVAFAGQVAPGNGQAAGQQLEEQAEQYATATNAGAALSNNSWSYTDANCAERANMTCYEAGAEAYDRLVLDGSNPARDRAISIVVSAGNFDLAHGDVVEFEAISLPNNAKNTVAVGNINAEPSVGGETFALSDTSRRGPADDGRVKPDLVAPGDSTADLAFGIRSATKTNHVSYPYQRISGTSMAAPAVTGTAALLVQQFRMRAGETPWPSTLKALLIHSARDLCCTDGGDTSDADTPGPDYAYGFGALDTREAVDLLRDARGAVVIQAPGFAGSGSCPTAPALACDYDADASADDDTYPVELPEGLASFRTTLVWDDLPQAALLRRHAPALRNDLDLYLIAPGGAVHRPWRLDRTSPASAATRDVNAIDNVEVVDVDEPISGSWQIVVRPRSIDPSDLDEPAQRYSLVYQRPAPDVMIRDYPADDGGVPSVRRERDRWVPTRYWHDPDVFIDGPELLRPGEARTLHVLVTNAGPTTVGDATVELFFADQGVGLDYDDFTANQMGSCAIPSLAPGETSAPEDCAIPFAWQAQDLVLGDDGAGHVCLLARVTATGDEVTFPGRASIPAGANPSSSYVPWDNNLAQQNLAFEDVAEADGEYDFDVHNPSDSQTRVVEVVIDSSELPSGWSASLSSGPIFSLPAGGKVATRLQITPPAAAVEGDTGHVSIHGRDSASGALLSGVRFTLVDSDADGDAVRDPRGGAPGPLDNCEFRANPAQDDIDANGRGDACECGDVNDDGRATAPDVTRLRESLAGIGAPLSPAGLAKCSVVGTAGSCDVVDVAVLRRWLRPVPLAPGIAQTCSAASP